MTFKTCRYCGHRIPVSAYYCPYCTHPAGARLWITLRSHPGRALLGAALIIFLGWRLAGSIAPSSPAPTATQAVIPTNPPAPTRIFVPSETPTLSPTLTPTFTLTPTVTLTPSPTATPTPIKIVTRVAEKDGMPQAYVPAGQFKMGSARSEDPKTNDEEVPQHLVYLDAFWIDQTEVTNAQYALCVKAGACTNPAQIRSLTHDIYYGNSQYADFPVMYVSWHQAAAYCTWAGRALPTEAQWEKAARGPNGRFYPWGNVFDGTLLNYCDINCVNGYKDTSFDDGYTDTARVGDYPGGASVYGALDMSGNVYEWVADWYGPYTRLDQSNPTGPTSGTERVMKGGSWGDDVGHVRSAVRSHVPMDYWENFIGFRCAESDQAAP